MNHEQYYLELLISNELHVKIMAFDFCPKKVKENHLKIIKVYSNLEKTHVLYDVVVLTEQLRDYYHRQQKYLRMVQK